MPLISSHDPRVDALKNFYAGEGVRLTGDTLPQLEASLGAKLYFLKVVPFAEALARLERGDLSPKAAGRASRTSWATEWHKVPWNTRADRARVVTEGTPLRFEKYGHVLSAASDVIELGQPYYGDAYFVVRDPVRGSAGVLRLPAIEDAALLRIRDEMATPALNHATKMFAPDKINVRGDARLAGELVPDMFPYAYELDHFIRCLEKREMPLAGGLLMIAGKPGINSPGFLPAPLVRLLGLAALFGLEVQTISGLRMDDDRAIAHAPSLMFDPERAYVSCEGRVALDLHRAVPRLGRTLYDRVAACLDALNGSYDAAVYRCLERMLVPGALGCWAHKADVLERLFQSIEKKAFGTYTITQQGLSSYYRRHIHAKLPRPSMLLPVPAPMPLQGMLPSAVSAAPLRGMR